MNRTDHDDHDDHDVHDDHNGGPQHVGAVHLPGTGRCFPGERAMPIDLLFLHRRHSLSAGNRINYGDHDTTLWSAPIVLFVFFARSSR